MKSTLQYLALGLSLADQPLLAEIDEKDERAFIRRMNRLVDTHTLLNSEQELHLLEMDLDCPHPYMRLQATSGKQLKVKTLARTSLPSLAPGSRVRITQERRGWSLSHANTLLAFIPNRYGCQLLLGLHLAAQNKFSV